MNPILMFAPSSPTVQLREDGSCQGKARARETRNYKAHFLKMFVYLRTTSPHRRTISPNRATDSKGPRIDLSQQEMASIWAIRSHSPPEIAAWDAYEDKFHKIIRAGIQAAGGGLGAMLNDIFDD